jgi:hypothetical protein
MDVRPLSNRHMPFFRPHLPDAPISLHPLARSTRRHPRVL